MNKHKILLLRKSTIVVVLFLTAVISANTQTAKKYDAAFVEGLKKEALVSVAAKEKAVQEMVDMVFSFGELGFQEIETSKYITGILEKNGFKIERGISGIPTAWMAKWGNGSPVIALGSDIDCIPKASQKPGVAYKDPIVEGAPGHGVYGTDILKTWMPVFLPMSAAILVAITEILVITVLYQ